MARKIQHNDLFYRKPPPSYRSNKRRRPVKRRSPLVPAFLVILVIVGAVLFFQRDKKEPEIKKEASSEQELSSGELGFEVVSEENPNPEISTNYDNMEPALERDITNADYELFNTMMIVDKIGYRYFAFSESSSIDFINLVKDAKVEMGDGVNFCTMVLPEATDIMLPQIFLADVSQTSDQQKALDYLNASINAVAPGVQTIDTYDMLKANCDADIFFKTDRNWTALGAYYGYRMYANSIGLKPIALTEFEEKTYDGFKGSFYGQSNNNTILDYTENLITYTPSKNITAAYSDSGSMVDISLITDPSSYSADQKYSAFLGGDYAYMEIKNADLSDGSSLVVVKDSMGNAMIPYLACHYETIYVVDYQSYAMSVPELVSSTGAKNVLLMCRISATSENYYISLIDGIM